MVPVAVLAASCSSSPGAGPATTTTHASAGPAAENLVISAAVRRELIAALAAQIDVPVSQYTGLAPGLTYYALDRRTGTYWAGAKPVPAPSSDPDAPTRAQVASQDDGAYDVFDRPPGGHWVAHGTGAAGPGAVCSVTVPPAVLAAWGWAPGSCRPAGA